ncbi:hypothetical protein [Candidatus Uabimicrobium amorphum]|uniref:Uncharacterized protein n=1 Tax=Uabimicrobium amorphum TaxID=2596890 RepID=A0A5S9ITF1_UABAM|nr:hypothetical protein [Candidatus Uabimicrobium amorphum]BBM87101.1 hypothetical protein UABAM_05504 [Candidatus Uabimicrobium amorphum]
MRIYTILFVLLSVCFAQGDAQYTPSKIGDEGVMKNVFEHEITVRTDDENESVKKAFTFTAPQGWRILKPTIHLMERTGESKASYHFSDDATLKHSVQHEKTKTHQLMQQHPNVTKLRYHHHILSKIAQSHKQVVITLHAKSSVGMFSYSPGVITAKVDVGVIYVGDAKHVVESIKKETKQLTHQAPKKQIKKVHPQSYLDIITETSYLLSYKMKKDEEQVTHFIGDLKKFMKSHSLKSVKFVVANQERTMFCNIVYNLTSNKVNTLPVRQNIYNLSSFLKHANLEIHIKTLNEIVYTPHNWKKVKSKTAIAHFPYLHIQEPGVNVIYKSGKEH